MRFLKIKYIVPLLIVIAVGTIAGLYFIGDLKINYIESDNIAFSEEGFINFNSIQYDDEGKAYTPELVYNEHKVIGENDKYILVLDEKTTIATVYFKNSGTAADYSDYEIFYQTANPNASNADGANIVIDYASKSSGKSLPGSLNTLQHSVKFNNSLTGKDESYYKIKYLEDGGAQILYEVGRFSAGKAYLPQHFAIADFSKETVEDFEGDRLAFNFNKNTLEGRFRGNTVFVYNQIDGNNPEIDEFGNKYFTQYLTGTGTTWSPAAANYIEKNGLATVTDLNNGTWLLEGISDELLYGYGEHLNADDSPVTVNPFYYSSRYNALFSPNIYRDPYINTDLIDQLDFPFKDIAATLGSNQLSALYEILYVSHNQLLRDFPVYDLEGESYIRGGFHATDAEGNYLYEDGKPVQKLYDLEQVAEDNAIYGVKTATSLERFQIGLQLVLTDKGLEVSIMQETLRDADHAKLEEKYNHDFVLDKVSVLPKFSTVSPEKDINNNIIPSDGMIVIPDGSGAVIDFKNWQSKLGYPDYGKTIYGSDNAFVLRSQPESVQNIMFGMYGLMDFNEDKGIMAIVEKGAAQTSIFASVAKSDTGAHSAYFNTKLRQNENVITGSGWNVVSFPKMAKSLTSSDIVYNYVFLGENDMSYSALAERYREYLIDLYELEVKDNTKNNLVDLNFLGAYERYDLLLGIRYMKDDSLTTFAQAQEIIDELLGSGVDTISAGYLSWTTDEMERTISPKLKASPALGGNKGIKILNEYLEDKGIAFYPEVNVTSGKGYDYNFGSFKYSARGVGNAVAKQYPFNLATMQLDRSKNPTYHLSPAYYSSHVNKMMKGYNKLNIDGAYLPDLGNRTVGTYKANEEIYTGLGTQYQMEALELLNNSNSNLKVAAPFDYALPYINLANMIPVQSTLYGVFDYSIPFYQMVISGLVDYTMDYVNGTSDKSAEWFLIKALETGSNLQFLISYEDPKVLLETDYTMYYKAFYNNWKNEIIEMNNEINQIGIHQGRLVNHEVLQSNLVRVIYEIPGKADLVLELNTGNITINYGGSSYNPYSYKIVGGGI